MSAFSSNDSYSSHVSAMNDWNTNYFVTKTFIKFSSVLICYWSSENVTKISFGDNRKCESDVLLSDSDGVSFRAHFNEACFIHQYDSAANTNTVRKILRHFFILEKGMFLNRCTLRIWLVAELDFKSVWTCKHSWRSRLRVPDCLTLLHLLFIQPCLISQLNWSTYKQISIDKSNEVTHRIVLEMLQVIKPMCLNIKTDSSWSWRDLLQQWWCVSWRSGSVSPCRCWGRFLHGSSSQGRCSSWGSPLLHWTAASM